MESDAELRSHWALDPDVVFLNHGSFGACPREVLDSQSDLRARLERQPVDFFVRQYYPALDTARLDLADFLGADPEGLAFVNNATTGVNAVLRSLDFRSGDELLVTDHAYNACRNVLDFVAERAGATVIPVSVPFPITSEDQVVDVVSERLTERTRLVLLDHVTSATGLVLPVARIAAAAHACGAEVLVDGAHAPGMIPLDLDELGVSYYTGNAHKWLCAPKGAAFLWVRQDRREDVRPAVISHGANMPTDERPRFRHEFDWMGTQDPTPALCVPHALRIMENMVPGGWPEIMQRNRELTLHARRLLAESLGVTLPAPDSMIGSLATLPLPDGEPASPSPLYEDPLQERLWHDHRIEVPIGPWPAPPRRVIRISSQLYNHIDEYQLLADALRASL